MEVRRRWEGGREGNRGRNGGEEKKVGRRERGMRKGGRGECGEEKGGVVHKWKAHTHTEAAIKNSRTRL